MQSGLLKKWIWYYIILNISKRKIFNYKSIAAKKNERKILIDRVIQSHETRKKKMKNNKVEKDIFQWHILLKITKEIKGMWRRSK